MTHARLALFTLFLLPGCYHAFDALEELDAGSRGDGGSALEAGRPDGGALDADRCEDVCATPPPAECIEDAILRTYAAVGACAEGACTYAASDMPCMFGCAEGHCIAGELTLDAYLKASNTNEDDWFGISVSLSADGSVLAVGAFRESSAATGINGDQSDNSATQSGAVYLFRRGAGTWTQEAYLKASNTNANDRFGGSLSLSADGSVLVVGVPDEDSATTGINGDQSDNSTTQSGAVYVYRHD